MNTQTDTRTVATTQKRILATTQERRRVSLLDSLFWALSDMNLGGRADRYATPRLGGQLRHVYGGTVPPEVVARRRARNRVARKSRRINRGKR